MKVVNVKGIRPGSPRAKRIYYCGRACNGWPLSPLANEHPIHRACPWCRDAEGKTVIHKRGEAIPAFKKDLWQCIQDGYEPVVAALQFLIEHPELDLGCWCSPLACHCDVIMKCIEWMKSQQTQQTQENTGETS